MRWFLMQGLVFIWTHLRRLHFSRRAEAKRRAEASSCVAEGVKRRKCGCTHSSKQVQLISRVFSYIINNNKPLCDCDL